MRAIVPYIFWPWFATSCFLMLRRRVSTGTWRPLPKADELSEFPPLPEAQPEPAAAIAEPAPAVEATPPPPVAEPTPEPTPAAVAVDTAARPRSRSLAEALEGISMPCDLAPLIGGGDANPREIAFFTSGVDPETVGTELGDEFERLGFTITPIDDSSIRAGRGDDLIRARLLGADLTPPEVMSDLHPSAPAGALVVELKLT